MGNTIDCEEKETITYESIIDNQIHITGSKIESNARILQSKIWKLQHDFYTHALPRNWKYRQITSGISSSSYLAKSYANLILSYAYDLNKQKAISDKDKLLVFDFGAGQGKLTYLIISHILKQKQIWFSEDEFPFLFIMTDCSQSIINSWKQNEYLKPFIEKGYIDMCCYDVEQTKDFILQNSRKRLRPEDIQHPPFVIMNSVLSCLRQDVVRISPSGLLSGKVTVTSSQHEYELHNPSIISRLQFKWTFEGDPLDEPIIGWDKEISQLICSTKTDYAYATFVIPVLGIQVMNTLLELFNHCCVFCIGDEGAFLRDEVQEVKDPVIRLNGDIRMPINFDFIRRHVELHNGWTETSSYHEDFRVLLCAYGLPKQQVTQLRLAYRQFLISQSHNMIQSITADMTQNTSLSLHLLIQLLRLSAYDPDFFLQAKQSLHSVNASNVFSRVNIHDLIIDLNLGREQLYPTTISHDACFDIARMYMLVQEYQTAADLFARSIKDFGEHHASWFNRGVCLYRLNQFTQAQFCFYRTLELNYEYEEARKYLRRITNNCHYTITEFETPIEEEKMIIHYNEQLREFNESDEEVDEFVSQSFVIDDVNFSTLEEEVEVRREEEYIMIEQASEDEIRVENIAIPDKDDE